MNIRYFGALTSKNLHYTFNGRKWELDILRTFLIQEPFFLYLHLERRGQKLLRILPVVGSQDWLNNHIRFFGLQRKNIFNFSSYNNKFLNFFNKSESIKKILFNLLQYSFIFQQTTHTKQGHTYIDNIASINIKILQNILLTNFALIFNIRNIILKNYIKKKNLYTNFFSLYILSIFCKISKNDQNIDNMGLKFGLFAYCITKQFPYDLLHFYQEIQKTYKFINKFCLPIMNTISVHQNVGYFYTLNFTVDYYQKLRLFDTPIIAKNFLRDQYKNIGIIYTIKKKYYSTYNNKPTNAPDLNDVMHDLLGSIQKKKNIDFATLYCDDLVNIKDIIENYAKPWLEEHWDDIEPKLTNFFIYDNKATGINICLHKFNTFLTTKAFAAIKYNSAKIHKLIDTY